MSLDIEDLEMARKAIWDVVRTRRVAVHGTALRVPMEPTAESQKWEDLHRRLTDEIQTERKREEREEQGLVIIPADPPADDDLVSIMVKESMARTFEERCLGPAGVHTRGNTRLSPPVKFSDDDLPTYIIEVY